ncbi:nitrate- and nitrite sensing domain-containing protein [Saccharomonospora xinjiangensis]|uniref:sensor histidine kinase n=1 Tax=Saccharomonospora xinjiangensis TaxID=75294 RepID=UPI00106F9EDA|nr:nitrate- and nitrite sensing domain-containing protein [Saccharomonospora xinjiangensis]QBQ61094.1 sensory histidine kinase CreC [Saccharomonospora xinjiangensis]
MKVASDGQVPVGELLGEEARPRSGWRAALRWRDWNLPLKLGAVTLVPIVIAVVLGAITLGSRIGSADEYEEQNRLAEVSAATRVLLDAVQRERTLTAAALTDGEGLDAEDVRGAREEVDRARAPLTESLAETGDRLSEARAELDKQLAALGGIRERAEGGQLGAVEAVTEYRAVTAALLDVDTAVVSGIGADDGLGATADAMHDLLVAREEVSVHQALVAHGIAFGLAPSEFGAVRTADVRRADRLAEFSAAATEAQRALFDQTVHGAAFDEYQRVVDAVLSSQDAGSELLASTDAGEWAETAAAVFTAMGTVADRLGEQLTGGTGALADDAGTGVGMLAVALVVSFVLAAAVVFVIARQLLRSLKVLRNTALEVAEHDLPEAVQAIQEGHTDDTEINPVPISTRDEIGEVARAFDAVHSEALRLAAEQAGMRAGYASVFVNLSRRSQSLVQRQLQLIERLERDEEDADQLATLFQLDHLATRMRRNNENLMVLSGAEPARRSGQPVSATDVLRAAVSEIEQYQRVTVRTPPPVSVVGYAAGDLIRLVAELLDNATAFSAPETQVTVATRQLDDASLSIDILDKGIGMNEAEVAEANERLSEAGTIDRTTSRRMGLFVVGRLASRHGFGVELHGGKDIVGVRATVAVPAELVTDEQAPYPVPDALAGAPANAAGAVRAPGTTAAEAGGGAVPEKPLPAGTLDTPGGPLPRRRPGRSAAARSASPGGDGAAAQAVPGSEMAGSALFTPAGWDEAAEGGPTPPRQPASGGVTAQAGDGAQADVVPPAWPSEAQAAEHARASQGPAAAGRGRERGGDRSGEPLSGSKLFEANSTAVNDWWSAAVTETDSGVPTEEQRRARKAAVDNAETTPIFDEMVSAWFRKVTDAAGSGSPEESGNWDFAADRTWKTVQEVSQREAPSEFTEAGLPRRKRGERLLPGSATPGGGESAERSSGESQQRRPRDPADVLGRLSSFQQGVTRGRRHRREDTPGDGEHGESQTVRPRRLRPGAAADAPSATETTDVVDGGAGLFTDNSRPSTDSPESAGEAPDGGPAGTRAPEDGTASWAFAVDERWRTVDEVSRAEPTSYTASGLPRRRRGERLLPGSAAPEGQAEPRRRLPRDPADVRGRLASFQQGVRRGRHHTASETGNADERLEGE